jgi:hypothetical protein
MAAISHVFTIRRAAQILGRDEDLLWELSDQLELEDGPAHVKMPANAGLCRRGRAVGLAC